MSKIKRYISFRMLPASWGLIGKSYDMAEAEYNYDGEDLEREKIKINLKYGDISELQAKLDNLKVDSKYCKIDDYEYETSYANLVFASSPDDLFYKKLSLELKYGNITEYEYLIKKAEYSLTGLELDIAKLGIDLQHNKINKQQHDKSVANLTQQPWIDLISHGYDSELGINGVYFEFDWNDRWIAFLKSNGYNGNTEEDIIQFWFTDICKAMAKGVADDGPVPFGV